MAAPKRFKLKKKKKNYNQISNNSTYIKLLVNDQFLDKCSYFVALKPGQPLVNHTPHTDRIKCIKSLNKKEIPNLAYTAVPNKNNKKVVILIKIFFSNIYN
jgi:hypothetical protein